MIIKFKSIALQNGQEHITNFKAEAEFYSETIEQDGEKIDYKIISFSDPDNNLKTKIELNPKSININNNVATVQLRLKKTHNKTVVYNPHGELRFKSYLYKTKFRDNVFNFEYELLTQDNDPIGTFKIDIELVD